MHWIDWIIVAAFLGLNIGIGIFFSRKGGENMDSFFVSGRTLKWYIAGASMIATSFAADTPLWVGSLIRQYGIHAVWQYWTPLIGCALGVALFSRMWRRTGVVTDNEVLELRYSGKSAQALRGISAALGALLICPMIIGWVCKAMVTIAQEALGISGQTFMIFGMDMPAEMIVTIIIMTCAVIVSTTGGLMGAVYSDFIQFLLATAGAFMLAWLSVREVGGLKAMVETLSSNGDWLGNSMNMAPQISTQMAEGGVPGGTMSIWNAIGFFTILWWGNALCGGYQAQRILACKNTKHASNALLMFTLIYFAVLCWPWIAVSLSSLIVFPDMGEAGHDAAYPRMLLTILPIGLRGIMIGTLIAAFTSTVQTMFNWGSSYIVNDLYRRFAVKEASDKHYVRISRIITVLVAFAGGFIAFNADNIQQLLGIFYVVGGGGMLVGALRWLWWRINAVGEIASFVVNWVVGILMLFGHVIFRLEAPLMDGMMSALLRLPEGVSFTNDYDLLGARMLFMVTVGVIVCVVVSLCTPATDKEQLEEFVKRTRIHKPGWMPVIRGIEGYIPAQTVPQILFDWALVMATVCALLFTLANVVRCRLPQAAGLLVIFIALLLWVLRRTRNELGEEETD
ncbi:sodium:solute symporter family protein [Pontiella sulfatireligans]|uniref:Sodium/glucose cotransporter n=1 Tax=Pontiella sulfatireligans TaxID=2750658 RepID=A0A6C2UEP4_9BACT|nr:sodium:solute symporter family protein [Pontiella sulfatireligans]VGO18343.1 Sodium/glucose cotransporter [Pontiella sulfatireligans]